MSKLDTPITLMKRALASLDDAGEKAAACYLQRAIDAVERIPPMQPGDLISDEMIDRMLTFNDTTKESDRG